MKAAAPRSLGDLGNPCAATASAVLIYSELQKLVNRSLGR